MSNLLFVFFDHTTKHCIEAFQGSAKKNKKGKIVQGKPFTLPHCWEEFENDEKWKNRDLYEVPRRASKKSMGDATMIDADDASSEDGNSVAKTGPMEGSIQRRRPKNRR